MSGRDQASVPFIPTPRPVEVLKNGTRLDGRSFEEFRGPLILQQGVISQASGSAYVECGSTKVMVGVYGPRQGERRAGFSEQGRINCDVKFATFATRTRGKFGQSAEERELSAIMHTALEAAVQLATFPKAVVDVFVLVLEAGGSELAAAITGAGLALADAGIELVDLVAACSVSLVQGSLLLDPSADEVFREEAGMLLALMPTTNEVTHIVARGQWSDAQFKEAIELCMGGCQQLDGALRQCLQTALESKLGQQQQQQQQGGQT